MSSVHNAGARRHSYSSFAGTVEQHQHQKIPTCETSHPDDPIPVQPKTLPLYNLPPPSRTKFASKFVSPRSSGESLGLATDNGAYTSDSESPLTPTSELSEEINDKLRSLPLGQPRPPQVVKKRRASTTYASNAEDIRRIIGSGTGTKFLQKYCCGEGCCMVETLPLHGDEPGFAPISEPDNAAYRFLGLDLRGLSLDTPLTKIGDVPEEKISFGPIRRESIEEKFPQEAKHRHDASYVNTYAPEYMQPHPPYNIFSAPVYDARELTKPGAEKRTFHFDIDVTDYPAEGGVDFKVGGAIGVSPPNDPAVVEDIMNQLGIPRFQRDRPVRLVTQGGRWPTIWGEEAARELVTTKREVLTWTVDITSQAPTKPLLRLLAEHASDANERHILNYICSAQGQAAFCDLRDGPHITLQQLLHAFPSSKPPLESICGVLNQLMPRFYSLSNDPHVSAEREGLAGRRLIEIAVTIHETPAYTGSKRSGVGSGFMERIAHKFVAAEEEARKRAEEDGHNFQPGVAGRELNLQVPMFRGLMSNPLSREFASDGPMVLIGAGVGMAPFRGFILNRLKNANCANKIWLIQGIRDSMLDEIYRGELGAHEKDIKKVVQSRAKPPPVAASDDGVTTDEEGVSGGPPAVVVDTDKAEVVAKYVQDEVRLQADIVWFVINSVDGRIFVCGSTKGMGEGVEAALMDVAMDKGNLDFETAKQFWQGKKNAGQYIAETW